MTTATETVDGTAVEIPAEEAEAYQPPAAPAESSTELVAVAAPVAGSTAIIHAGSPKEVLEKAEEIANLLSSVIVAQGMRTLTGRQKVPKMNPDGTVVRNERGYPVEEYRDKWHVNVEGWQTLASFLGIAPRTVYSRPVRGEDGHPRITRYEVAEKRTKGQGPNREVTERTYTVEGYDWEARVVAVKDGVVVGEAEALCTRSESAWAERDDFALSSMAQTRATSRAIASAARWIVTLAGFSGTPAEEMPAHEQNATGPAGPVFGPAANEGQRGQAFRAIAYLLGVPPTSDAIGHVVEAIERKADGYLPAIAGQAVGLAAGAVKAMREAAAAPQGDTRAEQAQEAPAAGSQPTMTDQLNHQAEQPPAERQAQAQEQPQQGAKGERPAAGSLANATGALREHNCSCPAGYPKAESDFESRDEECPVHGIGF